MKTIEVKLFTFDELSDKAKDKARDWYLKGAFYHNWWEFIYQDAETIGLQITSFDLDRNRHAKGKFTKDANHVADLIIANHGEQCETHKDAIIFLNERDSIVDNAEKDENGDFVSEYELDEKLDEIESEFFKTILEDYSIMLQKESDYIQSNESIDENIRCNEYTFLEDGTRF